MDSGLPPASNEVPVIVEVYKASAEPPSIFNHEVFIIILEDTFPAGKIGTVFITIQVLIGLCNNIT